MILDQTALHSVQLPLKFAQYKLKNHLLSGLAPLCYEQLMKHVSRGSYQIIIQTFMTLCLFYSALISVSVTDDLY